jgi:hypothetical protein
MIGGGVSPEVYRWGDHGDLGEGRGDGQARHKDGHRDRDAASHGAFVRSAEGDWLMPTRRRSARGDSS